MFKPAFKPAFEPAFNLSEFRAPPLPPPRVGFSLSLVALLFFVFFLSPAMPWEASKMGRE